MSSIIYQPTPVQTPTLSNPIDPTLYVFIINARHLAIRRERIKGVVKQIADLYKYRVIPKFISTNDPGDLEPMLANMKDRISYDQCGDADYDKLLEMLNIEVLSNYFKHADVWLQITNGVYNPNDLFLVIEDDCSIMPQTIQQVHQLLTYVSDVSNHSSWDMLFPGLAQPKDMNNTGTIELTNVVDTFKVIPSKESYFIIDYILNS